jgi:hypothetical protein
MSANDYRPWWNKVADTDYQERENFLRGIPGFKNANRQSILLGLVAGYVGGKIAQRQSSNKKY